MTNGTTPFGEILLPNKRPYTLGPAEDADLVGVQWYGLGPFHREFKVGSKIRKKLHYRIESGDVIYNKLFAWKGSFGVVEDDLDGMLVSDKFPTYELDTSRCDPSYLGWYFRAPRLWSDALSMSKGSAAVSKLTLNPPDFMRLRIPLPSMPRQRRIAGRLNELSERIDRAISRSAQIATDADELLRSKQADSLLAPGSNSISMTPLGEVVLDIKNGRSPKAGPGPAEGDEYGVLALSAVTSGIYREDENKVLPPTFAINADHLVSVGDLLLTRSNTPELVAACAVVEATSGRIMRSDLIFRLDLRREGLSEARFVAEALRTSVVREQIGEIALGTSSTMRKVSKARLMGLTIPYSKDEVQKASVADQIGHLREATHLLTASTGESSEGLKELLVASIESQFSTP